MGDRKRGGNRKDRKMVEDIAREKGMTEEQRREFGDYIEAIKEDVGRGGAVNFSYQELQEIADQFLQIKQNRSLIKAIAREKQMTRQQYKEFQELISAQIGDEGMSGPASFTEEELRELADEFLEL